MTEHTPKPLLPVGGRPLLEILIQRIAMQGFRDFYLTIHFEAEQVRRQFGDGRQLGVRIHYAEEDEPLGTAGALRFFKGKFQETFVVVNGDVLTAVNFEHLLDFHSKGKHAMTVAVRPHSAEIPFGVVRMEGENVVAFEEKPVHTVSISAGMYVLEPSLLELIPAEGRFDMPQLIQAALSAGRKVAGFPLHEYWLDVGRPQDYQRAQADVKEENL